MRCNDFRDIKDMVSYLGLLNQTAFKDNPAVRNVLWSNLGRFFQRDCQFGRLVKSAAGTTAAFQRGFLQLFSHDAQRKLAGGLNSRAAEPFFAQADAQCGRMVGEIRPPRHGHQVGTAVLFQNREQAEWGGSGEALGLSDVEILHDGLPLARGLRRGLPPV